MVYVVQTLCQGKDIKIGGYYSEIVVNFRIVAENNQKTSFMRKNSK
jgi:hypothetical protein